MIFMIEYHHLFSFLRIQHSAHLVARLAAFLKAFVIGLLILDHINIDPVFKAVI